VQLAPKTASTAMLNPIRILLLNVVPPKSEKSSLEGWQSLCRANDCGPPNES
jgi:hypothetical protein